MAVPQVAQLSTLPLGYRAIPEIPMLFIFCSRLQQVVCGEAVAGESERISSENSSSSKVRAVGEQTHVTPFRSRIFLFLYMKDRG